MKSLRNYLIRENKAGMFEKARKQPEKNLLLFGYGFPPAAYQEELDRELTVLLQKAEAQGIEYIWLPLIWAFETYMAEFLIREKQNFKTLKWIVMESAYSSASSKKKVGKRVFENRDRFIQEACCYLEFPYGATCRMSIKTTAFYCSQIICWVDAKRTRKDFILQYAKEKNLPVVNLYPEVELSRELYDAELKEHYPELLEEPAWKMEPLLRYFCCSDESAEIRNARNLALMKRKLIQYQKLDTAYAALAAASVDRDIKESRKTFIQDVDRWNRIILPEVYLRVLGWEILTNVQYIQRTNDFLITKKIGAPDGYGNCIDYCRCIRLENNAESHPFGFKRRIRLTLEPDGIRVQECGDCLI